MRHALQTVVARVGKQHPKLPIRLVFAVLKKQYKGRGSWFAPSSVAAALPDFAGETVLRSIQVLSDQPSNVLITRWVVFGERDTYDPMNPDDQEEFDLDAREAFEAAKTGSLVHPKTGSMIRAEGRVALYFLTNDSLWEKAK